MIRIEELENLANIKQEENIKFRTFLKNHADPKELDEQFKQLHDKYFSIYDCSKCRNCCKQYYGTFSKNEIEKAASFLELSTNELKDKYLQSKPDSEGYKTKNYPCDFFQNGECILKECKPETCKEYPYTNKNNRLGSLWGVIDNTAICPVVYEIFEELKKLYNFR